MQTNNAGNQNKLAMSLAGGLSLAAVTLVAVLVAMMCSSTEHDEIKNAVLQHGTSHAPQSTTAAPAPTAVDPTPVFIVITPTPGLVHPTPEVFVPTPTAHVVIATATPSVVTPTPEPATATATSPVTTPTPEPPAPSQTQNTPGWNALEHLEHFEVAINRLYLCINNHLLLTPGFEEEMVSAIRNSNKGEGSNYAASLIHEDQLVRSVFAPEPVARYLLGGNHNSREAAQTALRFMQSRC